MSFWNKRSKPPDRGRTLTSKAHQSTDDRLYAILRRLANRLTQLELQVTALKRDTWRIEKKQTKPGPSSKVPRGLDEILQSGSDDGKSDFPQEMFKW